MLDRRRSALWMSVETSQARGATVSIKTRECATSAKARARRRLRKSTEKKKRARLKIWGRTASTGRRDAQPGETPSCSWREIRPNVAPPSFFGVRARSRAQSRAASGLERSAAVRSRARRRARARPLTRPRSIPTKKIDHDPETRSILDGPRRARSIGSRRERRAAAPALTAQVPGANSTARERTGGCREEDVPASPQEPQEDARLPQTDAHERRSRGAAQAAPQGEKSPHGQDREKVRSAGLSAGRSCFTVGQASVQGQCSSQKLPRRRRIAKRKEFLAIQAQGRKLSGGRYLVFLLARRSGARRLGVTVSRKVGNAVMRNRVKRWIRESWRRLSDSFPAGVDVVVIARPAAARAGYRATLADLRAIASRARQS